MSSVDPLAAILGGIDRPVQPRREFAETLLNRLLEDLGGADAPTRKPWSARLRVPRIVPAAPRGLRLALIVLALLFLLAAVALATYFGVRTWISAGPRGVQYTSDFRLAVVFREPPRPWSRTQFHSSFVLAPSGRDIYAVRYLLPLHPPLHPHRAELVRIARVASGGRAHEERLLAYRDLAEARLWDPGTDLRHSVIGEYMGPESVAVAGNDDVFLLAAARPTNTADVRTLPAISLIVRHRDGSLEKVLTFQELVSSGVLGASGANHGALGVAASAPDRLWLSARPSSGFLVEVIDPNGDGNWADRVLHRLRLPSSFPTATTSRGGSRWSFHQLLAEPSVAGEDRSRSVLVTASRSLAIRVWRIADLNSDGDAMDKAEVRLLFRAHRRPLFNPTEVTVAPRTVVRNGKVVLRELVASGFSRPTRISRLSYSGNVTDVGRSFYELETVLAGRDGSVYAVVQVPPSSARRGQTWTIYRLTPADTTSPDVKESSHD